MRRGARFIVLLRLHHVQRLPKDKEEGPHRGQDIRKVHLYNVLTHLCSSRQVLVLLPVRAIELVVQHRERLVLVSRGVLALGVLRVAQVHLYSVHMSDAAQR